MKKQSADTNNDTEANSLSGFVIYQRLLGYLKPQLKNFIISIIGFGIFAASAPMLAKVMETLVHCIERKDSSSVITLPLFIIIVFIIRGVGSYIGTFYNALVSGKIVADLRTEMFNHITTLPSTYFDNNSSGKILQRLVGSVGLLSKAITDSSKVLIREGLTFIFLLGYAIYLNWQLSLTFLAVTPFTVLAARYTSKRFRNLTREDENIGGGLIQTAKEMISGHEIMKIYSGYDYEKKRYQYAVDQSLKRRMKVAKIESIATPTLQLLGSLALAAVVYFILQPGMLVGYSAGALVSYITTVALIPKSLRQLSGVNVDIQRGIAAAEMIFRLLDTTSEPDEGTFETDTIHGNISANNVTFRYKANRNPVLRNISFDIKSGQMVAFVGNSGSGKSTLAALIQRLYNIEEGAITIDGVDIRNYKLKNLRQHISFVSQNNVLIDDTIRNNIAYGSLNHHTDEEILLAAEKAQALEFINELPKKLDALIGDNGLNLSGGQRQRIAIARAFLKDAPIIIFDEATSALDNESERKIQQAIESISKGRTTIVIAHRLSTIEKADKIFVMHKGKIIEEGFHAELINKIDGKYRTLYSAQ